MIDAVMKRFRDIPAKPTKETMDAVSKKWEDEGGEIVLEAATTLEQESNSGINGGIKEASDDEKKPQVTGRSPVPAARRRKA
jgi:hypothetical protein